MLKNTRNTCICTIQKTENLWHNYFFTYCVLLKDVSQKTYLQKPIRASRWGQKSLAVGEVKN